MHLTIALCGLPARNARVLSFVINSIRVDEYAFRADNARSAMHPHIALIDATSPEGLDDYARLRQLNPRLISVTISADGSLGDSPYRIESRSLFLKIAGTLTELLQREILAKKPTATPVPAPPAAERPDTARAVPAVAAPGRGDAAPMTELRVPEIWALVVDDSPVAREQVRGALARAGIGCEMAADAEEAMSLLQKHQFDLAMLDVVMPGADGYALCRRIRQMPAVRQMPVLMLTSRSSPFDRARGALCGCDSYLTKPIAWNAFVQAIDKALMKRFRNDRALLIARGFRG